jgi:hypothetical protein
LAQPASSDSNGSREISERENAFDNTMCWTNSSPDLNDAYRKLLDAMFYYVTDRSDTQLQAMSLIAAKALDRHELSFVEGLDEALKRPTGWEKTPEAS